MDISEIRYIRSTPVINQSDVGVADITKMVAADDGLTLYALSPKVVRQIFFPNLRDALLPWILWWSPWQQCVHTAWLSDMCRDTSRWSNVIDYSEIIIMNSGHYNMLSCFEMVFSLS